MSDRTPLTTPSADSFDAGEGGQVTHMICKHAKEKRALLDGYEVVCECGEAIGRVALHQSDVVFGRAEARRLLGLIGDAGEGTNERAKLQRAVTS